jgi:diamine N-acetyltransferase
VRVVPVNADTWRAVCALEVRPEQGDYVATPAYYLALCSYGTAGWRPLAVLAEDVVVGFLMWAVDPADGAAWLGGILIDAPRQRRGLGAAAVRTALSYLHEEHGARSFALSYQPSNTGAAALYRRLGFVEGDEWEDDEVVARLTIAP